MSMSNLPSPIDYSLTTPISLPLFTKRLQTVLTHLFYHSKPLTSNRSLNPILISDISFLNKKEKTIIIDSEARCWTTTYKPNQYLSQYWTSINGDFEHWNQYINFYFHTHHVLYPYVRYQHVLLPLNTDFNSVIWLNFSYCNEFRMIPTISQNQGYAVFHLKPSPYFEFLLMAPHTPELQFRLYFCSYITQAWLTIHYLKSYPNPSLAGYFQLILKQNKHNCLATYLGKNNILIDPSIIQDYLDYQLFISIYHSYAYHNHYFLDKLIQNNVPGAKTYLAVEQYENSILEDAQS
ncbi:hypothetical protein [Facklamia lactis]|uniref:hypothetical protein n=1 Tax=Facklamia lactis TaxID=2749967 RepID=UPI0018CE6034|nr:hypothetical protein [Facklamia lactis]MBG9980726.1 hypothetical protein [Facklamia lactis]